MSACAEPALCGNHCRLKIIPMVSHPKTLRRPFSGNPRGFALLITITLLAFLVLLLVSLASLTRVETQVAGNNQQLGEARQNALMALNIAIGQLQKYAGPDQRTTSTADLIADKTKSGASIPAPLYPTTPHLSVQAGARYWTAVWGNNENEIRYSLPPDQIPATGGNRRGITPGLLNWLVSGNESAAILPKGTLGGTEPGTGIVRTPADAINLSDLTKPTIGGDPAVLLVGSNSVGSDAAAQADYVVAPLVDIKAAAGSLPGSPNAETIGRYAWWIGDEGVKARVNLQNGYQKTNQATDQIKSFIISQRAGIEFMDGATTGTAIGADYDFNNPALPRLMTKAQLPLIGSSTDAQGRFTLANKARFHDLTSYSFGVLSDTYAGGLKNDLTSDIADTSNDFSYRPADSDPIFTPISTAEAYLPTWGHLRTWARTHPNGSGEITPQPATNTNAGIGPVLLYSALGYDIRVHSDRSVTLAIFPVVALFNPYTTAIAPAQYDVGFKFSTNSRMAIQTAPPADPLVWSRAGEIDWGAGEVRPTNTTGTLSKDIYFTVNGQTIPPGEAHIYYLSGTGTPYTPGGILERAPAGSQANPLNYVYLPSTLSLDSSVSIQDPTSYLMRVINAHPSNSPGTVASDWGGGLRAKVTLAQPGGLGDPDRWYQRSDVLMGTSGGSYAQMIKYNISVNNTAFTMSTADPIFRISKTDNWLDLTQGPRGAFRFCPRNVGLGDYNGADRTGMPQINLIWLRHSNVRAAYGQLTNTEALAAGNAQNHCGNMLFGVVLANDNVSGRKVALFPRANQYVISLNSSVDAFTPLSRYTTLFDILDSSDSLLSLGQLQHVPFSRYSFYSTYPFGNSMAELRIPRSTHYLLNNVPRPSTSINDPSYDLSWHLNRAMWDKYFLSATPTSLTQSNITSNDPLPNSRLTYFGANNGTINVDSVRYTAANKGAYELAAANLLNAGAFNINSTSEQAWRAVLSGTYGVPQNNNYASNNDKVDKIVAFPRFSKSLQRPVSASGIYQVVNDTMKLDTTNSGNNFYDTYFHGNRGLYLNDPATGGTNDTTPNLVKELARTMVEQVRARGPFLSLGDFVNRSMFNTKHELGIKGAIQSAIDNMDSSQANPYAQWPALGVTETGYKPPGSPIAYPDWDPEHYLGGSSQSLADHPSRSAFRLQYAFGPKYLTQADVLSTTGPSLTPRSDTFIIRTYGEKINAITGEIEGKAWCEAVVQRTPDFVDSSNPAKTPLANVTDENKKFGRRFMVISYRWLTPSEI